MTKKCVTFNCHCIRMTYICCWHACHHHWRQCLLQILPVQCSDVSFGLGQRCRQKVFSNSFGTNENRQNIWYVLSGNVKPKNRHFLQTHIHHIQPTICPTACCPTNKSLPLYCSLSLSLSCTSFLNSKSLSYSKLLSQWTVAQQYPHIWAIGIRFH